MPSPSKHSKSQINIENHCSTRATPHKDNNKITVQSITKCGNQNGYIPQGCNVKREYGTNEKQKRQKKALSSDASAFLGQRQITFSQKTSILKTRKISVALILSRLNSFAQTESWGFSPNRYDRSPSVYSTVTLFARFLGLSTSNPRAT